MHSDKTTLGKRVYVVQFQVTARHCGKPPQGLEAVSRIVSMAKRREMNAHMLALNQFRAKLRV